MTGILLIAVTCAFGAATQGPAAAPAIEAARPLSAAAERVVTARARAWWSARERRDHQRMYDLFEPAYRKQVTFADFLKESAVRTRFDLADTRIEAVIREADDRVRVRINMETRPGKFPNGRVTAEDIWVRRAGSWYKVHEEIPLPFPTSR